MKHPQQNPFGLEPIFCLVFLMALSACQGPAPVTVYLVRQAEKDLGDKSENPALNGAWKARAQRLKTLLANGCIGLICPTAYQRNNHTVEPLAAAKGLSLSGYEWHGWGTMFEGLLRKGAGKTEVICGHGDNLLPMISFLKGTPPLDSLVPYGYDKFFKVTTHKGGTQIELLTY